MVSSKKTKLLIRPALCYNLFLNVISCWFCDPQIIFSLPLPNITFPGYLLTNFTSVWLHLKPLVEFLLSSMRYNFSFMFIIMLSDLPDKQAHIGYVFFTYSPHTYWQWEFFKSTIDFVISPLRDHLGAIHLLDIRFFFHRRKEMVPGLYIISYLRIYTTKLYGIV